MGTQCYIAIELPDGSIQYIVCYYDGYIRHMVKQLRIYTRETLLNLIQGGDIVSLAKPGEESDRMEDARSYTEPGYSLFVKAWAESGCEYCYMLTDQDKWICHTRSPIDFDEFQ